MEQRATWKDRYLLSLKEELTIKEMMLLLDCGEPRAVKIRDDCRAYCVANDIIFFLRKIPTESIFAVTNKDIDYYYDKMLKESRAF